MVKFKQKQQPIQTNKAIKRERRSMMSIYSWSLQEDDYCQYFLKKLLYILLSRILGITALLQKYAQNIMSRRNHEQILESSQEAEEVQEHLELEEPSQDPSEEEGEDLLEDAERDYASIENLDHYEDEGVDHEEYEMNPEARKAAQKQLNRNERYEQEMDDVEAYMEDIEQIENKRARAQFYAMEDDYDEADDQDYIDAEQQKGRFDQWINLDAVRRYIRHHLHKFLMQWSIGGKVVYYPLIKEMVLQNKQSLSIDYTHLRNANKPMAIWLAHHPIHFIPQLNAALYWIVNGAFPNYKSNHSQCFARIYNLPVLDNLRTLSHEDLGKLIKFYGVITTRSEIYSQLIKVFYKCYSCGHNKGPFYISKVKPTLGRCQSCQSLGPFIVEKMRAIYRNFQYITIQESPSQVAPGRIPRCKEVILVGDIIDTVKPGEEVEVTGVFASRYQLLLNCKHGFPVFNTYVEANSIRVIEEVNEFSKIDQQCFEKFARTPDFDNKFFNSIAPSVFGHLRVKKALTAAMFGGVSKTKDNHRTRGDINVLLLGDPGIAKSQFLKSIQKVFPRCVYTTGKGASSVGLTASVRQDPQTSQWRLEAGALVIADKGICLIDEFDKMNQSDRTSIHQAMEQQTISISKAGIVTNLNARCAVIAAANPLGGRYEETLSFKDNVNLTDPILSRFDILNVIKDRSNEDLDRHLSEFVINLHRKHHPYNQQYNTGQNMIQEEFENNPDVSRSLDFFKQYIKYAREKYHPKLTEKSSKFIQSFYIKLREYSLKSAGIDICPRHLQSMIRICQSHARMHLHQETSIQDAKYAVDMMLRTFRETQKYSVARKITDQFKDYLLLK